MVRNKVHKLRCKILKELIMAIKEKAIGTVMLGNEIEDHGNQFSITYWDTRFSSEMELRIPRELVIQEFNSRGKSRGVCSYWNGEGEEDEHDLSYEEFEQEMDYRDEFDGFIQELASELLNLDVFKVKEELKEASAEIQAFAGEVLDLRISLQLNEVAKRQKEERIRILEKTLYELTNPQIKKVS
jgi:hypothetical protein